VTRASPGFHYVADTTGVESQHIVGDAGPSSGRQVITFASTYGMEQFTLLLLDNTVYFQGNTPAFEDQLGVPAARAQSLQSAWISVSVGEGPYTVLHPGITAADQAQEMSLLPTSTTTVTAASGVDAVRVLGTLPPQQNAPAGAAHVDIAAGSHLPIRYMSTVTFGGTTVTSTNTFSNWGTAPSVTAPPGAVAWSSLGGAQPPGGYGSGGANPGATPSPQGSL
jgi:hypothetical protein